MTPWRRLNARMLLVHPIETLVRLLPALLVVLIARSGSDSDERWELIALPVHRRLRGDAVGHDALSDRRRADRAAARPAQQADDDGPARQGAHRRPHRQAAPPAARAGQGRDLDRRRPARPPRARLPARRRGPTTAGRAAAPRQPRDHGPARADRRARRRRRARPGPRRGAGRRRGGAAAARPGMDPLRAPDDDRPRHRCGSARLPHPGLHPLRRRERASSSSAPGGCAGWPGGSTWCSSSCSCAASPSLPTSSPSGASG